VGLPTVCFCWASALILPAGRAASGDIAASPCVEPDAEGLVQFTEPLIALSLAAVGEDRLTDPGSFRPLGPAVVGCVLGFLEGLHRTRHVEGGRRSGRQSLESRTGAVPGAVRRGGWRRHASWARSGPRPDGPAHRRAPQVHLSPRPPHASLGKKSRLSFVGRPMNY
jgi:hypothetical protein